ncbi:hypothetical protein NFI96_032272 [Prochilodus magdalenae]|nr:hypothetical protein NFI96_032272 [Prochilodus magdalenae]
MNIMGKVQNGGRTLSKENPVQHYETETTDCSVAPMSPVKCIIKLPPAYTKDCIPGSPNWFTTVPELWYSQAGNTSNANRCLKILESDFRDPPKKIDKTVSQEDLIFLDKF